MTIVINLCLHTGCIGGIFITGIFGNFYTKRGGFLTFRTGIPGGLAVGEDFVILACVVFTQCQRVTDGQTDRRLSDHS